jgi:hypothetical protein
MRIRARIVGLSVAVAAATAGLAGLQAVLAQGSDEAAADLNECVNLESPEERFACYEARRDAVLQEREHAQTAAEAEAAAQADATEPELPSTEAAQTHPNAEPAHQAESPAQPGQPALPPEVFATITALRETVPDSYLITLDNGQVWRQVRPKWYPMRVGHEVRVYPTGWGTSYRLSVSGLNGFIQVERAR